METFNKDYRDLYQTNIGKEKPKFGKFFLCPCCFFPTLSERAGYEICPLCNWEDDGQDDPLANEVWGGPNGDYSLSEARTNFSKFIIMYRLTDSAHQQTLKQIDSKKRIIGKYNALFEDETDALWNEIFIMEKR